MGWVIALLGAWTIVLASLTAALFFWRRRLSRIEALALGLKRHWADLVTEADAHIAAKAAPLIAQLTQERAEVAAKIAEQTARHRADADQARAELAGYLSPLRWSRLDGSGGVISVDRDGAVELVRQISSMAASLVVEGDVQVEINLPTEMYGRVFPQPVTFLKAPDDREVRAWEQRATHLVRKRADLFHRKAGWRVSVRPFGSFVQRRKDER